MKITKHDMALSALGTGFCLATGMTAAKIAHRIVLFPHGFQALYLIAVFSGAFFCSTLFLLFVLRKLWPLQDGVLHLSTDAPSLVWKLMGYFYVFQLGLLINSGMVPVNLRTFFFRLLGARIGQGVMVGGKILDPSLVEIGPCSMLGEDSILMAHAVEGECVDLGRIVLGTGVTVGAKAIVFPGVRIGDNAIVASGAIVTKGNRIPAGEIWGGIPARKIGQRD